MQVPCRAVLDAHAPHGPTYTYCFTWGGPQVGACHGIDIPFPFGNFVDGWDAFVGLDDDGRALSARCAAAWAALRRAPATRVGPRTPRRASSAARCTTSRNIRCSGDCRPARSRRRDRAAAGGPSTRSTVSVVSASAPRATASKRCTVESASHGSRPTRPPSSRHRSSGEIDAGVTPSRAATSSPSSASGPVRCSGPSRSARTSASAATAAMSDGSIHAILPAPVGSTSVPCRDDVALLVDARSRRTTAAAPSTRTPTRRAGARSPGGCRAARCRDRRSGCSRPSRSARRRRAPRPRSRWSRARPDPASATTRGTCSSRPAHARRSDARSRRSPTTTSATGGPSAGSGRRTNARTDTPSRRRARDATSRAELAGRADHEHRHGRRVSRIPS